METGVHTLVFKLDTGISERCVQSPPTASISLRILEKGAGRFSGVKFRANFTAVSEASFRENDV